ncbi:MAG: response regulator [Phenylobacterium sp.]|uniref:response regulator n=1 Tax=Phenylobacterium sp. TaxID=1871053 RepID=UPI0025F6E3C2|nr:response regulator [Phenylobacterium sp.]MBI1199847.1 response regulator [Phenylobacterium sp.]
MSSLQPFGPRAIPTDPAAALAHDLKNLLAVIMGACEALAEGLEPTSEQAELARVGALAAQRAGRLLDNVDGAGPLRRGVEPPPGEAHSVLVIDDDPDLLQLMVGAFRRAGFKAYSAANGRVGVQLMGALRPDLIVTDIVMPEKEGIATIIEARQVAPDTPVIAISGGGAYGRQNVFLQWAEELGADAVMAKPFPMASLVDAARGVLAARAAARPGPGEAR